MHAGDVVPFTSVTGHVDYAGLAHQSLLQFHATSEPELEQKCYMNRCEFDQAQRLIGNADETVKISVESRFCKCSMPSHPHNCEEQLRHA